MKLIGQSRNLCFLSVVGFNPHRKPPLFDLLMWSFVGMWRLADICQVMSSWKVTLHSQTQGNKTCKYLKSDIIWVFSNPNISASFIILAILVVAWGNSLCEGTLWRAHNTVSSSSIPSILTMRGKTLWETAPSLNLHSMVMWLCVYSMYVCAWVCFREEIVLYFWVLGNSRPFSAAGRDYGQLQLGCA